MAGIKFSVRSNMKEVLKDLDKHPKIVEQAAVSALNRVATRARTEARRAISKEFGAPQKVLRGRFGLAKARRGLVSAALYMRPYPLWPPAFGKMTQTKAGVRVGRHSFPGAWARPPGWTSNPPGGSPRTHKDGIILKRSGEARYPLEVMTVNIWPRADDVVRQTIDRVAGVEFVKRFRHEYDRRIGRLK